MQVDTYSFGRIRIDGVDYSKDVILLGDTVLAPWWRDKGHVYSVEDLKEVIAVRPNVVILGTGFFGRVRVPRTTVTALEDVGCEVVVERTTQAVAEFNRLTLESRGVVAALHLTC